MLISPVSGGDCADQREESWRVCGKDPPFLLVCRSQIREREREREREGERSLTQISTLQLSVVKVALSGEFFF